MSRGELREMKLGTLGEERVERREGKVNEREREREEEGGKNGRKIQQRRYVFIRVGRRKRIAIFKQGGREQEKNIFEAKNARVGKRATLISLVYGVAFCLINTPVVNHPCTGVLPILHLLLLSFSVCADTLCSFFSIPRPSLRPSLLSRPYVPFVHPP